MNPPRRSLPCLLQPFIILGILGMPNSWCDVLLLDLDLDGMLREGKIITAVGTLFAFVRPTIPGTPPRWLSHLFPSMAWLVFSDESKVIMRLFCFIDGVPRIY